jgi:hypothetical protein
MTAIVPFDFSAPAPVTKRDRPRSMNADLMIGGGSSYPVLSIKGKMFTIVKDGSRHPLMRTLDDEEVPVASLQLTVVRGNARARVFYAKSYVEGDDGDSSKPTCFSYDGQRPDPSVENPQASNCQLCPHAQWGTKLNADGSAGKGTACTVRTRLAVVDPKDPKLQPYLLSVPAGSRASLSDAARIVDSHGKEMNEVVLKISFDQEAPSPKLKFEPKGLVAPEIAEKFAAMYDEQIIKDIVGTPSVRMADEVPRPALAPAAAPKLAVSKDAAPKVAAQEAQDVVLEAPAASTKPRAAAKPKSTPAPAPKPAASEDDGGGLLTELASVLNSTDD